MSRITKPFRQGAGPLLLKLVALVYVLAMIALIISADRNALPAWMVRCASLPHGDTLGHFILFGTMSMVLNMGLKFKRAPFFSGKLFLGTVITFLLITVEEFFSAADRSSQLFINGPLGELFGHLGDGPMVLLIRRASTGRSGGVYMKRRGL